MRRAGAAAAANDLRAGGEPLGGHFSEVCGIARASPAACIGIPAFAGVGIDDDGLAGGCAEFVDQSGNKGGLGAVDAYRDGLREACSRCGTFAEQFAVDYELLVAAGKGEPRRQVGPWSKSLGDGFRFSERRQSFKGEQVGDLSSLCASQHFNSTSMKVDKIGVAACVVAVIFGAVVQRCSVGTERCGYEEATIQPSDGDLRLGTPACGKLRRSRAC